MTRDNTIDDKNGQHPNCETSEDLDGSRFSELFLLDIDENVLDHNPDDLYNIVMSREESIREQAGEKDHSTIKVIKDTLEEHRNINISDEALVNAKRKDRKYNGIATKLALILEEHASQQTENNRDEMNHQEQAVLNDDISPVETQDNQEQSRIETPVFQLISNTLWHTLSHIRSQTRKLTFSKDQKQASEDNKN